MTEQEVPEENLLGALRMEALPYVQMAIPGVPYSVIRVPVLEDPEEQRQAVWRAMEAALLLRDAAAETFAEPFVETVPRLAPVRPSGKPSTPMVRPRAAAQAPQRGVSQRAAAPDLDASLVVQGFCPEHQTLRAQPSIPRYQEIEITEDGEERYAKYFCDGNGQRHSLWAREIVAG